MKGMACSISTRMEPSSTRIRRMGGRQFCSTGILPVLQMKTLYRPYCCEISEGDSTHDVAWKMRIEHISQQRACDGEGPERRCGRRIKLRQNGAHRDGAG